MNTLHTAHSNPPNDAANYSIAPQEKIKSVFLKIKEITSHPDIFIHEYVKRPLIDSKNCMTALIKYGMTMKTMSQIVSIAVRIAKLSMAYFIFPNFFYAGLVIGCAGSKEMRVIVNKIDAIVEKIRKLPLYMQLYYSPLFCLFGAATIISGPAVGAPLSSFYISAKLSMSVTEFFTAKKKPLEISTKGLQKTFL